jgi:proteic killer suppression protein
VPHRCKILESRTELGTLALADGYHVSQSHILLIPQQERHNVIRGTPSFAPIFSTMRKCPRVWPTSSDIVMYLWVHLTRARIPDSRVSVKKKVKACKLKVDTSLLVVYTFCVIRTWRHKGLTELFENGRSRRVRQDLQTRALLMLDALDSATVPSDLHLPGFDFHRLRGHRPPRYSIHVYGPWCITFEFQEGDALRVNLEQYH